MKALSAYRKNPHAFRTGLMGTFSVISIGEMLSFFCIGLDMPAKSVKGFSADIVFYLAGILLRYVLRNTEAYKKVGQRLMTG